MKKKLIRIDSFSALSPSEKHALFTRKTLDLTQVKNDVIFPMAEAFRKNPMSALKEATLKYDRFCPEPLILTEKKIKAAYDRTAKIDPTTLEAFRKAAANITAFHEKQIQTGFETQIAGNTLGMRFIPFDRAALYVPGGKALYPST
ncbi:MAG TPA: histidinol dehydrogenase, partial [Turneriella sp.]|nr:histidinol dehydrogenase [Turneriella sp.]